MKRFATTFLACGLTLGLAAGSLWAVPPAKDAKHIVDRKTRQAKELRMRSPEVLRIFVLEQILEYPDTGKFKEIEEVTLVAVVVDVKRSNAGLVVGDLIQIQYSRNISPVPGGLRFNPKKLNRYDSAMAFLKNVTQTHFGPAAGFLSFDGVK